MDFPRSRLNKRTFLRGKLRVRSQRQQRLQAGDLYMQSVAVARFGHSLIIGWQSIC